MVKRDLLFLSGKSAFERGDQRREIACDDIPDNLEVDVKISVDQTITCSCNAFSKESADIECGSFLRRLSQPLQ